MSDDPQVARMKIELQQYQDLMHWINADPVAKDVLARIDTRLREAQAELLNEIDLSSDAAKLAHAEARSCSLLFQTLDSIVQDGRQAGKYLKEFGDSDG